MLLQDAEKHLTISSCVRFQDLSGSRVGNFRNAL